MPKEPCYTNSGNKEGARLGTLILLYERRKRRKRQLKETLHSQLSPFSFLLSPFSFLLFTLSSFFFNVACATVARATLQRRCLLRATCRAVHLSGLLHRTLDTQFLHILVRRDLRVDVVTLDHQRQRQSDHKKSDCHNRNSYNNQPTRHLFLFFISINLGFPLQIYTFVD